MENFVRDYGTGNQIPDPPAFVNYNTPDVIPSSSSRPTTRPAQFTRSSQREIVPRQSSAPPSEPEVNTAGIGAGGSRRDSQYDLPLTRQSTQHRRSSAAPSQQAPQVNGSTVYPHSAPATSSTAPSTQSLGRQSTQSRKAPPHDPLVETIDPTAETFIKVGSNAYKVDLSKDPQMQSGPSSRPTAASPSKYTSVDPLAKHMEDLKNAVSSSGSVRRKSFLRKPSPDAQPGQGSSQKNTVGSVGRSSSLSPPVTGSNNTGSSSSPAPAPGPAPGPPPIRDYRNSAELVVGVHPSQSRPASPNPPTAAFMDPKPIVSSDSEVIEGVLTNYHQSLPGERKSISRTSSIRQSPNPGNAQNQSQSQGQNLGRPASQIGPGIGAHGGSRSNSPQPPSRGPSPAPNPRNSYINPPSAPVMRSASPNTVGIALDPSGRVMHDDMAQRYQQQQQQQQQRPHQQQQMQPPPQPQYTAPLNTQQRRSSYMAPVTNTIAPPTVHQAYGVTPPPQPVFQAPPSSRPGYVQAPPIQPPPIQPPPVQKPAYVPPYAQPPQQPIYQQPPQTGGYQAMNGLQRGQTLTSSYYPNGGNQHQMANQRLHPQQTQPLYGYHDPIPAGRTPSPAVAPTGQTTEEGVPILFYGAFFLSLSLVCRSFVYFT